MTPKEKQRLLFKRSTPMVRPLNIMDGDKVSKDSGVLWAAYKQGSFPIAPDMTQEDFIVELDATTKGFNEVWIIDDDSSAYSSGRGPVAMVAVQAVGLIVEPRFTFFKWATCRNVLKSTVAFLHKIRRSAKTGIMLVRTDGARQSVADHMHKYGLLFFIGKSAENEYLYSGRGRGTVRQGHV